jgi:MFS family permease
MANLRPVRPTTETDPPASSGSFLHWLLPGSGKLGDSMPALQSRDFRLFWFGQMISMTGTWIQSVAQQWLVLKLTGSAFALGLVTTVQFTPLLLMALFSGAIADRVSKRELLLATQVASLILALVLGVLVQSGTVRYWHVLVIAAMLGIVNAFYTPARQAYVPELVPREALMNAVALNSAVFNAARVLGPAVGGVLIAVLGLSLNFYLNALSFVAVIIGLLLMAPRPVQESRRSERLLVDVKEGIDFISSTSTVLVILLLIGVASTFALNFSTLLPLIARYVLHVGSEGYGFLSASSGLGSLSAAIGLAFITRRDLTRVFIYAGAIGLTVAEIFVGFSRTFPLTVGLLVVIGVTQTFFTTTANTTVLSMTPSHLQGRVMSVYSLMFLGTAPFGSFMAGLVAQRFGAPAALILGGAITLVFTVVVFFIRRRQQQGQAEAAVAGSG